MQYATTVGPQYKNTVHCRDARSVNRIRAHRNVDISGSAIVFVSHYGRTDGTIRWRVVQLCAVVTEQLRAQQQQQANDQQMIKQQELIKQMMATMTLNRDTQQPMTSMRIKVLLTGAQQGNHYYRDRRHKPLNC